MVSRYVKERDEAILSLDREKIIAFCNRWHICLPTSETALWAGVHKMVVHTASATEEQRQRSLKWLEENGFRPEIYDDGGEHGD